MIALILRFLRRILGLGAVPAPAPAFDPMRYLVQSRALDGNPATPLRLDDPLGKRRSDGFGQVEDSFQVDATTAVTAWSYAPFGPFAPANGDGGERYEVTGGTARIVATRDGSKPDDQFFVLWPLFAPDADLTWRTIGQMTITRYTRRTIAMPDLGAAIDCIVSEHYDGASVAASQAMERFIFGLGWGRLCWQSWERAPAIPVDPARAPDFGWNTGPAGFVMRDCRVCTKVVAGDPKLTPRSLWR